MKPYGERPTTRCLRTKQGRRMDKFARINEDWTHRKTQRHHARAEARKACAGL